MKKILKLYSDDFYKEKANESFEKGLDSLSIGEYGTAYSHFIQAIELDSSSHNYYFFAGLSSYYFQEKTSTDFFERAAAMCTDKVDYQLWYGISLYRDERFLDAKKVLQYTLNLDVENEKTILYLLKTLNRLGHYNDVIGTLNTLISLESATSDMLYEIGYSYLNEYDFKNAIKTLLESIDKDIKNVMAYHLLSRVYCKTGEFDSAIDILEKLASEVILEKELVNTKIEAINFLKSF